MSNPQIFLIPPPFTSKVVNCVDMADTLVVTGGEDCLVRFAGR